MLRLLGQASKCFAPAAAQYAAQPFRHFAKAAQQEALKVHVPTAVNAAIKIQSSGSNIDVRSRSGPDFAADFEAKASNAWHVHTAKQQDGRTVMEAVEQAGSSPPDTLLVTIPDKWMSIEVQGKGNDVSVAKVVEADLSIQSHGGNVRLGQVRAYKALVDTLSATKCGELQGDEVSGSSVTLRTGHGAITLRRLIGQHVDCATHDAPLRVKAMYAEDVVVHTGGGSIEIDTMDVSDEAELHSEGGHIKVHSLDGNADLHSSGGDVEVHLHSKVGMVRVSSGGGSVRVAISPQATVEVNVRGKSKVTCDDAPVEDDPRNHEKVYRFKPSWQSRGGKEPRYGQLSEGRVVVDAGGGPIEIVRVGWVEAQLQRITNNDLTPGPVVPQKLMLPEQHVVG